jgi:hypothetical protein
VRPVASMMSSFFLPVNTGAGHPIPAFHYNARRHSAA